MLQPTELSPTCAFHEYSYELRRNGQTVATGLVRLELELFADDSVAMSGQHGIVESILPAAVPGGPRRLVVRLA